MQKTLTYNDVKYLCDNDTLPVVGNRLQAVLSTCGREEVDRFLEVFKRYYDIKTRNGLTEREQDFYNQVIDVMDRTNTKEKESLLSMIEASQSKLTILLEG